MVARAQRAIRLNARGLTKDLHLKYEISAGGLSRHPSRRIPILIVPQWTAMAGIEAYQA